LKYGTVGFYRGGKPEKIIEALERKPATNSTHYRNQTRATVHLYMTLKHLLALSTGIILLTGGNPFLLIELSDNARFVSSSLLVISTIVG
jgi:hypothetical protein